jgi:predicted amidohydrolase YtcJ
MTQVVQLQAWLRRAMRLLGGAVAAVLVAGCAGTPSGPVADTVLVNGRVATVDARSSMAEAVAVGGGRILAVGTSADIRRMAGPRTRVVDLGGRTVIPGLIDNHTHVIRAAERWTQEARIDGISSRRQALDIIAARARAARPGEWVVVLGGWTEDQFTDQKGGFTREELDRAAPYNPVFMQVLFLRGYANSLALKAAGMDGLPPERTRVLPPPSIRRMHEMMPAVTQEAWHAGARTLMADLNRVGITAVLDVGGNGFTQKHYAPFAELDAKGALTVRFVYLQYTEARTPEEGKALADRLLREKPHRGSDYFRVIGIGENIYGPTTDNTYQPFEPAAPAAQAWGGIVRAAARGGWHVHQHATHDSTIRMFLDQIEAVDRDIPVRPLRWTLAHVDGISDASVERLRRLGMGVTVHSRPSIQGQMVLKRWGAAGRNMPDLRRIQDSGLPWGLGTDTTVVAPYSPFVSLWWAVSGRMLDGSKVSDRTLTRQEALVAHTRSNAWFLFQERNIGSLEQGKHADLVVLDRDYFTVPEDEIRQIRPAMTMVGGRVVYEAMGR